ncbi:MAG TPA: hypothetical protein VJU86_14860 [Pyrinomonadaceae bacterium]|nr:hypothetical protein [Pyrinomonadaceae bacterium]
MSNSEDRWFEVWFDQGEDVLPTYLLIVIPDPANPGLVVVCDPFENNRIVHSGQNYDDTCIWLAEDEYDPVVGRTFPDDGLPLATGRKP